MIDQVKMSQKMPTTFVLEVFSWLVAFFGFASAVYLWVIDLKGGHGPLKGFLVLFVSLFVAALVRMLANIGQMFFDSKQILEQINCDCKDMNLNIEQIAGIFEQIEHHLDFKK